MGSIGEKGTERGTEVRGTQRVLFEVRLEVIVLKVIARIVLSFVCLSEPVSVSGTWLKVLASMSCSKTMIT